MYFSFSSVESSTLLCDLKNFLVGEFINTLSSFASSFLELIFKVLRASSISSSK
ncbi:hypothetical protein VO64_4799 [Pseudomonas synxantha]|uniref:Uncharacterized protein n=1 Tax=Pseudomonas synxantha TaxID=47883 RepID=A0AAU8U1B3_9PSED|nr:hypothetical protein VO64_4799 [Pseudomonas synxantha]